MIVRVDAKRFEKGKREINNLLIFFDTKSTIYVKDQTTGWTILAHRWFTPKGFYTKNWGPFQRALKENNQLSIRKVCLLANKYEVDLMVQHKGMPEIPEGVKTYQSIFKKG